MRSILYHLSLYIPGIFKGCPYRYIRCQGIKKDFEAWEEKFIEKGVYKPVINFVTTLAKKCKKLPWWNPLKWLCWIIRTITRVVVYILVKVIVKIIILIIKTIIVTICNYAYIFVRLWAAFKYSKYIIQNPNGIYDGSPNPIEKKFYELVFNDEFNAPIGSSPDSLKWRTNQYNGIRYSYTPITEKNRAPYEYYSDKNFVFTGDTIRLFAKKEDVKILFDIDWLKDLPNWGTEWTIKHTVGMLQSYNTFNTIEGFFEVRLKNPKSFGFWNAFWLASLVSWPPELDICEFWTSNNCSYRLGSYYDPAGGIDPDDGFRVETLRNTAENFNVYGMEWNRREVIWYFNNIPVWKTTKGMEYFSKPMFIILNIWMDNSPEVDLSQAIFPSYLEVDYVRVYKRLLI